MFFNSSSHMYWTMKNSNELNWGLALQLASAGFSLESLVCFQNFKDSLVYPSGVKFSGRT